jgi:hypothetical protein
MANASGADAVGCVLGSRLPLFAKRFPRQVLTLNTNDIQMGLYVCEGLRYEECGAAQWRADSRYRA